MVVRIHTGPLCVRRSAAAAAEKFHGRLDYNLSLAAVRSRVAGVHLRQRKTVLTPLHMLEIQTECSMFSDTPTPRDILTAEHSGLTFRVEWMEEGVAPPPSFLP